MTSPRLLAALVAALAILPFGASLGGTFVYDDEHLIVRRTLVHSLASLPTIWTQDFWAGADPVAFRFYRPLVTTTYALDWAAYGGSAVGFHATNLALHALTAALAFLALRRWLGSVEVAFGCALAWAWHPMRAEAVAWISGRPDLLVGLGLLLCVSGFALRQRGHRALGATAEVTGLFVALTSKESGVVAPALIAMEAWCALGRPVIDRTVARRLVTAAGPHLAVCVAYGLARVLVTPVTRSGLPALPLGQHVALVVETLGELTRATVWPIPSTLQRAPLRLDEAGALVHAPWRLALGVITAALMAFGVTRRRHPTLAMGVIVTACLWFPVSNVIPTRQVWLISERFTYIPHLATVVLLGALLQSLPRAWLRRVVVAGIALFWSAGSVARSLELRTADELWEREHAVDPDAPQPLKHLAIASLRALRSREALALGVRGARSARTYAGQEGTASSLAAAAAEATSNLVADGDPAVARVDAFFVALLSPGSVGRARLDTPTGVVSVPAGGRATLLADGTLPLVLEWAARAAARSGACDRTVAWLSDPRAMRSARAALLLARCDRWEDALAVAAVFEGNAPGALTLRLREARAALRAEPVDLARAVARSNAKSLLGDDLGALAEIAPWRAELVDAGQLFLAEKTWAAGDEAGARAILEARLPEDAAREHVERWRRIRGR